MNLQPLVFSVLAACASAAEAKTEIVPTVDVRDASTLDRLLGEWDTMKPSSQRDELADRIDRVAGQRYATSSRMFWFTDLIAAKAEAKRTGKPILSLRMLGRLDEDLSCANSRYFRIALYANTELSKWLRDHFVLHWSSERPVPRITVDFGDGRKLERTITGNSIHYVLDADGRPIDALPGLYAPAVFKEQLARSLVWMEQLALKPANERGYWLGEYHRYALGERVKQWTTIGKVQVPFRGDGFRPEAFGQLVTVTKSGIEMPTYGVVDLGVNVGKLPDDAGAWAQVGLRLVPGAKPDAMPRFYPGRRVRLRTGYTGQQGSQVEIAAMPPLGVGEIIDASSKALLAKLEPMTWTDKPAPAKPAELARLVDRFERDILADTAINEFDIRMQVHGIFINNSALDFDQLNANIYSQVFRTPKTDAWLGLSPAGVLALPRDGLRQANADGDAHVRR